MFFCR